MSKSIILDEIDQNRRGLLGAAVAGIAASKLGLLGVAKAQSSNREPAVSPGSSPVARTSFASLKQVDAGVLNVGYVETGPSSGPPVILLHGWP